MANPDGTPEAGQAKLVPSLRLAVAACLAQAAVASAAPPPGTAPDPALHAWFESLRQPGNGGKGRPCCSISDCRFTAYQVRDGHYEIIVDGWTYVVPDETVLRTAENPTGRAVACYSHAFFGPPLARGEARTAPQDAIEILCFLPSKPLS